MFGGAEFSQLTPLHVLHTMLHISSTFLQLQIEFVHPFLHAHLTTFNNDSGTGTLSSQRLEAVTIYVPSLPFLYLQVNPVAVIFSCSRFWGRIFGSTNVEVFAIFSVNFWTLKLSSSCLISSLNRRSKASSPACSILSL